MTLKILALVPEASTARRCLDVAFAAAAVAEDADIEAFHVRVDPDHIIAAPEELAIQRLREHDEGSPELRAERVHWQFRAWLGSLPEAWRSRVTWRDVAGAEQEKVAAEARHADLAVLARPHNMDGADAQNAAIRRSHRPVLYVPEDCGRKPDFVERIVIAWKPAPQAERAVEGAAIWLRRAHEVVALMVARDLDSGGWEDIQHLARQLGFSVRPHLVQPDGSPTGRQLAEEVQALGAGVTVLGAYRFSDLVEWALPSTTRFMLAHAHTPLFLAH